MTREHKALGEIQTRVLLWVFGVVGTFHGLGIAFNILKEETPEGLKRLVHDHEVVVAVSAAFALGLVIGFVLRKIGPTVLRKLKLKQILAKATNALPD